MAHFENAKKWLDRAKSDYADALVLDKHTWPKSTETICYLCQQATEKALKTILVYNGDEVPKIHNIRDLMNLCVKYEPTVKVETRISMKLTDFAIASRYPDNLNEWTEEDTKLGLKYSNHTIDIVSAYLEKAEKETEDQEQTSEALE